MTPVGIAKTQITNPANVGGGGGSTPIQNSDYTSWDYFNFSWLGTNNNIGPFQNNFSSNLGGGIVTSSGAGDEWPWAQYTTPVIASSTAGPHYSVSPANNGPITQMLYRHSFRTALNQLTNTRFWQGLGLSNQASANWQTDNLIFGFVGFRFSSGVDVNFQAYMFDGISQTQDTGVAADTKFHTFEIRFLSVTSTGAKIGFFIDGVQVTTMNSNGIQSFYLGPCHVIDNKGVAVGSGFKIVGWKGLLQRLGGYF